MAAEVERAAAGPGRAGLDEALGRALAAVREASLAILEVYGAEFAVEAKEDRSPITEADRRAHRCLLQGLGTALPVLSEEGRHRPYEERREWRRLWLVDPLDGTKEFVKRNGEFTVNVCLVEEGRPVLGVVHAPVPDLLYFAHREAGAFVLEGFLAAGSADVPGLMRAARALTSARRSGRPPLPAPFRLPAGEHRERIRVVGSRSHGSEEFDRFVEELRGAYAGVEVVSIGSSLKPCYVAEGRVEVYPRFGRTMEWDTAAAHAVVKAAGKDFYAYPGGEELAYNKPDLGNPPFLVF